MTRLIHISIIGLWLVSMAWLMATKVIPPLLDGDPPDYAASVRKDSAEPDCWRIRWDNRPLGFAASRVVHQPDGRIELRSLVDFDELPVKTIASQLLGPMSSVLTSGFTGPTDLKLEMRLITLMRFDAEQKLAGFVTTLEMPPQEELVRIEAVVDAEGHLLLEVLMNSTGAPIEDGSLVPMLRHELDLPSGLVSETLAPRTDLKGLQLGQKWTIPMYRAFPPNSPVQIIQAEVVRHEVIFWDGEDVETMLVVYQNESGASIQSTRESLGSEWVRMDGTVLRQKVLFSGIELQFERLSEAALDDRKELFADSQEAFWDRLQPTVHK